MVGSAIALVFGLCRRCPLALKYNANADTPSRRTGEASRLLIHGEKSGPAAGVSIAIAIGEKPHLDRKLTPVDKELVHVDAHGESMSPQLNRKVRLTPGGSKYIQLKSPSAPTTPSGDGDGEEGFTWGPAVPADVDEQEYMENVTLIGGVQPNTSPQEPPPPTHGSPKTEGLSMDVAADIGLTHGQPARITIVGRVPVDRGKGQI